MNKIHRYEAQPIYGSQNSSIVEAIYTPVKGHEVIHKLPLARLIGVEIVPVMVTSDDQEGSIPAHFVRTKFEDDEMPFQDFGLIKRDEGYAVSTTSGVAAGYVPVEATASQAISELIDSATANGHSE